MSKDKLRICLVTSDIMGVVPNGGVGTSVAELAKSLYRANYQVEVLFANEFTPQDYLFHWWQAYYLTLGIKLISVPNFEIKIDQGCTKVTLSYLVYNQLKNENYHTIIFPEMHGTSYYCSLAKKAGLCFLNTNLWVMFHGPSLWHINNNNEQLNNLNKLVINDIEKKSLELADKVFFATEYAKKIAIENKFISTDTNHEVMLYPCNFQQDYKLPKYEKINSIVFFGRIETRKGIEEFLAAINFNIDLIKKKKITIYLLGKLGLINNYPSKQYLAQWMSQTKIKLHIIEDKNRNEALDFISKLKPLVVLPSREETMGYTLVECLMLNAATICSNIESYQNVLAELKIKKMPTFDLKSLAFANVLKKNILKPTQIKLNDKVCNAVNDRWGKIINTSNTSAKDSKKDNNIKFSLCITNYRRENYLKQIINQLTHIDTTNLVEILIYDDFSNSYETMKYLVSLPNQIKDIPVNIYFGTTNKGPSFARNMLATKSSGSHLVFLDNDNLLTQYSFSKSSTAIANTSSDIFVCPLLKFRDVMQSNDFSIWLPLSSDLSLNMFANFIGDANLCIKKSSFLKVGGFDEELRGREDQEFLMRSTHLGLTSSIIPEILIHYRVHKKNASLKENNPNNLIQFFKKLSTHFYNPDLINFFTLGSVLNQERVSLLDPGNNFPINRARTDLYKIRFYKDVDINFEKYFKIPYVRVDKFLMIDVSQSKRIIKILKPKKLKKKITMIIHSQINCKIKFTDEYCFALIPGLNKLELKKGLKHYSKITSNIKTNLLVTNVEYDF